MRPLLHLSLLLALAALPVRSPAAPETVAADGTTSAPPLSAPAAGTPLGQDDFIAAIARELSAHFNLEGDLQLELVRPCATPERLAREWSVQITEYPTLPASAMLIRCRLLADQAVVAESTVMLRATLWRDAWIARQPLTGGTAFDPSLLDARRVDFFRERDALPALVGDHTFIFARSVQSGRLLTWRDVVRRPLVKKGEVVEVSAAAGQLVVMMKALAMQNGAKGEAVTVRNLDSRKDFTAFVTDENRVQVRF
jgi:flagella basal body P-ring formation protein FlgA